MTLEQRPGRLAAWRSRWGGIAPLLLAEFIVWLGFGGLLPVLSIYFVEQGVDFATLGVVIAAWPIARLIGEPIFGWLADRTARIPLMVVGLVLAGVFTALPLAVTGPVAFIVLRAAVGLATAIYDPAARGYLTDATPPERRGEAFGLYGAAQMGGLLARAGDRGDRSGPSRGHRLRLHLQRRGRRPGGDPDRPDGSGRRDPDPPGARTGCDRIPAQFAGDLAPRRRRRDDRSRDGRDVSHAHAAVQSRH